MCPMTRVLSNSTFFGTIMGRPTKPSSPSMLNPSASSAPAGTLISSIKRSEMRELLSVIIDDVRIVRVASSHVSFIHTTRRTPTLIRLRYRLGRNPGDGGYAVFPSCTTWKCQLSCSVRILFTYVQASRRRCPPPSCHQKSPDLLSSECRV